MMQIYRSYLTRSNKEEYDELEKIFDYYYSKVFIGMFAAWCIENDLISTKLKNNNGEYIQKVKNHEMTGGDFVYKLYGKDYSKNGLCKLGNDFKKDYVFDSYDIKFAKYNRDFNSIFVKDDKYESRCVVEDTWENYLLIKEVLDNRFLEWKNYKRKK